MTVDILPSMCCCTKRELHEHTQKTTETIKVYTTAVVVTVEEL